MAQAQTAQLEGRWDSAEAAYRKILESRGPDNADAQLLVNWGQALRKLGKNEPALQAYRQATALADAPAAAWFNLGNALLDESQWEEAKQCFERATKLDAQLAELTGLQSARCAVKLGCWQDARELFAAVLRINRNNFSAWLEAGHLCQHHGTVEQVLTSYRMAVAASPQRWLGHATLANALERHGFRDEAAAHYWRAQNCADGEDGLLAHRMIGRGRLDRGDAAGAAEAFSHALRCAPGHHGSQLDLADALMAVGEKEGAQAMFVEAGRSRQPEVLARLGEVLFRHNHWQQAEDVFRGIVLERPADWSANFNLARFLVESWRMQEGLAVLKDAEALCPAKPIPGADSLRAAAAGKMGDVSICLDQYLAVAQEEGAESCFRSSAAMLSLYSGDMDASQSAALHRELFGALGKGARAGTTFNNVRDVNKRLRIGYITADLHHQHPVNLFMQPVLARHDTKLFEITVYFVGVAVDEQTRLARSRVARWRDVAKLNDARLAKQISDDEIDVLIDLLGHTTYNRRMLFANRAAPVQATFLGYPSSTGLLNMDWIIADAQVAPERNESLFSERVARLPHCTFCYAPEDDYPYPDYGAKHAKRPLTFGSFNNIVKLTPQTIVLWSGVLTALPNTRLLLKAPSFMDPAAKNRFMELFAAHGVDVSRIECREPSPLEDMMAEYADVDIALDTWPYNGGTTTCQALWMGVPTITLAGEGFWSRMGASILNSIGRPQWIAESPEQFVEIAKQLASKRANLLAEKKTLRSRMQASPAFDIDRYVRDLEGQYRMMWQDWCAKSSP